MHGATIKKKNGKVCSLVLFFSYIYITGGMTPLNFNMSFLSHLHPVPLLVFLHAFHAIIALPSFIR